MPAWLEILQLKHIKFFETFPPSILNEVFVERDCNYNLRGCNFVNKTSINTGTYGTKSVLFLVSTIWDFFPKEMKNTGTLTLNTFHCTEVLN